MLSRIPGTRPSSGIKSSKKRRSRLVVSVYSDSSASCGGYSLQEAGERV